MLSFVVYAGLGLLAGVALAALRRRKLDIINEAGLRIGLAIGTSVMVLLALKSLADMLA